MWSVGDVDAFVTALFVGSLAGLAILVPAMVALAVDLYAQDQGLPRLFEPRPRPKHRARLAWVDPVGRSRAAVLAVAAVVGFGARPVAGDPASVHRVPRRAVAGAPGGECLMASRRARLTCHKGHKHFMGGSLDGEVAHLVHAHPSDYPQTFGTTLRDGQRAWYELDYDRSEGTEAVYRFIGLGRTFADATGQVV